jgi:hypothetical protein
MKKEDVRIPPANAMRLANRLVNLPGAATKLVQLILADVRYF